MVLAVIATIVVPTLIIVVVAIVVGRRKAVASGEADPESVAFAGGILSALFTVVLAFYVVFAWQQGSDIGNTADTEADALIDAYWQAESAPEPQRATLAAMLRDYSAAVADQEWPALADGQDEPRPAQLVYDLRAGFTALPAAGDVAQVARAQGLRDVRQIDESHRARVNLAGDNAFNDYLLVGTILGGLLVLAFPVVAGLSAKPMNIVVITVLALTVGASVFLAIQMAQPLSGPFGAKPDAFRAALEQMQDSRPT